MDLSRLSRRLLGWLGRRLGSDHTPLTAERGPRTHVIILDGTMSSLRQGHETNAGLAYRLLQEASDGRSSLYYEAGVQWPSWRRTMDVMMGRGLNRQIRRAYGFLASRYRPGDRIYLIGYSRGAYAVRSLAGVIDMVGLLRAEHATVRNIRTAYRHYESDPASGAARAFSRLYCHESTPIEAVGVWDTVKALGLRLPLLWRLTAPRHAFHNTELGDVIRHGFHALALNETRAVFDPALWTTPNAWEGRVEQVWFRGTHGDIGGQLNGFEAARPLANIPLVWLLERLEERGLSLPEGWQGRFVTDADAPSVGTWRGWGKIFLIRHRRVVGADRSERLHETALGHAPDGAHGFGQAG